MKDTHKQTDKKENADVSPTSFGAKREDFGGGSYVWHVVDQQQGDGDGGDVVCAADFQDVPQAHDGRVTRCDVA